MIIEAILNFFVGIVDTVLGWLPAATPPDLSGAIAGLGDLWLYMGWANKYVPVVEVAGMLIILATVRLAMFFVSMTVWVLTKAHILGGS